MIKGTLILNDKEVADLRLLENTIVTLMSYNKVDNITVSKVYENVILKDDEDYVLEF